LRDGVAANLIHKINVVESVAIHIGNRNSIAVIVVDSFIVPSGVFNTVFDEGDSAFGNFVCEMKLVENFKLTYGSQLRLLPRRKRVHANIGIRKVANLRTRLARSVAQKRKCGRK